MKKKKSKFFKLSKKLPNTQSVENLEQEIRQIMKDNPNFIHHYLKDWKKMSIFFNQKENKVYDYFLNHGFKEPQQQIHKQEAIKTIQIANNITNNQQTNKRSRHNRMSVSSNSSSLSSNEKKSKTHKKQKGDQQQQQQQEEILNESDQEEILSLETILNELIPQLKDHYLTYRNICKLANIQFKNKQFQQQWMQPNLNYPALLLKFKTRIEESLKQEANAKSELIQIFNKQQPSSELNYVYQNTATQSNDSFSNPNNNNNDPDSLQQIQQKPQQKTIISHSNLLSQSSSSNSSLNSCSQSFSKELINQYDDDNDNDDDENNINNNNNNDISLNEDHKSDRQKMIDDNKQVQTTKSFALRSRVNAYKLQNQKLNENNQKQNCKDLNRPKHQQPPKYKQQTQTILDEVNQIKKDLPIRTRSFIKRVDNLLTQNK